MLSDPITAAIAGLASELTKINKASRARAERALTDRAVAAPTRLCIDEQSHLRGQVRRSPAGRRRASRRAAPAWPVAGAS
jgi:hypothetical protein